MLPHEIVQRLRYESRRNPERVVTHTGISRYRLGRMTDRAQGYLTLRELESIARGLELEPLVITEPLELKDKKPFTLVHERNSEGLEGYIKRVAGLSVSPSIGMHTLHDMLTEREFVLVYLAEHADPTGRSDLR